MSELLGPLLCPLLCPQCNSPLNADFGVVECANCGAVVTVEMEDSAESAPAVPSHHHSEELAFADYGDEESAAPSAADEPAGNAEVVAEEPATEEAVDTSGPVDFSDVVDFANSDKSAGREGAYLYDLLISQIDSREIKSELREAMTDLRLRLEVDAILAKVDQGRVTIRDLNPVKVSVLVNRLKGLPLALEWTQKSIVRSER